MKFRTFFRNTIYGFIKFYFLVYFEDKLKRIKLKIKKTLCLSFIF